MHAANRRYAVSKITHCVRKPIIADQHCTQAKMPCMGMHGGSLTTVRPAIKVVRLRRNQGLRCHTPIGKEWRSSTNFCYHIFVHNIPLSPEARLLPFVQQSGFARLPPDSIMHGCKSMLAMVDLLCCDEIQTLETYVAIYLATPVYNHCFIPYSSLHVTTVEPP